VTRVHVRTRTRRRRLTLHSLSSSQRHPPPQDNNALWRQSPHALCYSPYPDKRYSHSRRSLRLLTQPNLLPEGACAVQSILCNAYLSHAIAATLARGGARLYCRGLATPRAVFSHCSVQESGATSAASPRIQCSSLLPLLETPFLAVRIGVAGRGMDPGVEADAGLDLGEQACLAPAGCEHAAAAAAAAAKRGWDADISSSSLGRLARTDDTFLTFW
jgi:hypothetical protein